MPRPDRCRSSSAPRVRLWGLEALEDRRLLSTASFLDHHANVRPLDQVAVVSHAHPVTRSHHHRAVVSGGVVHAAAGRAHPMAISKVGDFGGTSPATGSKTPAQMRTAYGFDQVPNQGAGQTIAIIDAYDDPNIVNDLGVFDKQFGLTGMVNVDATSSTVNPGTFTEVFPSGSRPKADGGWAQEISLDVEWAHAIAPQANIMLVEAKSNSYADLLTAVDYATTHGATVVSMSWGGGESSGETGNDGHFNHAGVAYVASSGDSGSQEWPALSPNVLAVGGTALYLDSANHWSSETSWGGSGGGLSQYEATPSYQTSLLLASRGNPDVAYDADPNTGVAVYDSFRYHNQSGWLQFGGTSAGAPQWSALIAIADQGRAAGGKGTLASGNQLQSDVYGMTAYLHDITSGGSNKAGAPGVGYDLVTGLGTPRADQLITQLVSS